MSHSLQTHVRVHYFQHVHFEGLARIEPWLRDHRCRITGTCFHEDAVIPPVDSYDWLIVMGGPMGTHDKNRFPWLVEEKRAVENALAGGKLILGICLGAQILAEVLGAKVSPQEHREIGWHPIQITRAGHQSQLFGATEQAIPFHWHGDTFDIPAGAVHLASSLACENQAFAYGERVLGIQFHIESTPESIELLLQYSSDDLEPGRFVQSSSEIRNPPRGAMNRLPGMMEQILGCFGRNITAHRGVGS